MVGLTHHLAQTSDVLKGVFPKHLRDSQDAAFIMQSFIQQQPFDQHLTMKLSPEMQVIRNFLAVMSAWISLLLYVRFFTSVFDSDK